MTTSNPNVVPPAGGGDPDPDRPDRATPDEQPDPLLADRLEGAVPDRDDPTTDPEPQADSVAADRRNSGADG